MRSPTPGRTSIPTLGLCLGLQCMVIEYARSEAGLEKAASTEFDPDVPEPVIATMEEQKSFVEGAGDLGGTMRLGLYAAELTPGSLAAETYGATRIEERHRHRYEVNNTYRDQLSRPPAWCSRAPTPSSGLVEFVELPRDVHPYYIATQAHPELRSRPTRPHPLFAGPGRGRHRAPARAAVPDRRVRAAPARRRADRPLAADSRHRRARSGLARSARAASIRRTVSAPVSRFCRIAGCVPGVSASLTARSWNSWSATA